MRFVYNLVFGSALLLSCKPASEHKKPLQMYEYSEMAILMNTMYHQNEYVKRRIKQGKDIGEFPVNYRNIHSAVLTDPRDRNHKFEKLSREYIKNIVLLYESPKSSQKTLFNAAIDSCIRCHEQTCLGPIPKIKKLFIN